MKTILKYTIALLLLVLAGFIMDACFPTVVFNVLAGFGFLWLLYEFWEWVSVKLA
jgi:hypothetical protein